MNEELGTGYLRILEMYQASGQGEGVYSGVPSFFVRLAGCTVGCQWCDTKYSWKKKSKHTVDYLWSDVAEHIKSEIKGRHVVITGGEPMEQDHVTLRYLVQELVECGYVVTIETSGTVIPEEHWVWDRVWWSISPKLKSSGTKKEVVPAEEWFARFSGQLKFVIDCSTPVDMEASVDETLKYMSDVPLALWRVKDKLKAVIFQPQTPADLDGIDLTLKVLEDTRRLQEYITDTVVRNFSWSIGSGVICVRPQMHVLLYGHKRLV